MRTPWARPGTRACPDAAESDNNRCRFGLDDGDSERYHYHMLDGTYDSWKTTDASEADTLPPPGCPVCTGDEYSDPCSEECAELIEKCDRKRRIKGLYLTASSAMRWARLYQGENSAYGDRRILAILDQVKTYRREIARLRAV